MIGHDMAGVGLDLDPGTFFDVMGRAAFKYPNPGGLRSKGQSKGEIQRVQMRRPHVQRPAPVVRGRADQLQSGMIQRLNLMVVIDLREMICVVMQMPDIRVT